MSGQIVKVVLFYSKKSDRSIDMKTIVDETGIDIDCVSVDSSEVRSRILEDTKYAIRIIPSILVLYSNERHKVYTKQSLDTWFNQLIENIKIEQAEENYRRQQAEIMAAQAVSFTPEKGIHEKTPFYQRRMAAPGKRAPEVDVSSQQKLEVDADNGFGDISTSDVTELSTSPSDSHSGMGSTPHSIKTPGPKPADLAKKMMEMRESLGEAEEANKPFL